WTPPLLRRWPPCWYLRNHCAETTPGPHAGWPGAWPGLSGDRDRWGVIFFQTCSLNTGLTGLVFILYPSVQLFQLCDRSPPMSRHALLGFVVLALTTVLSGCREPETV